MRKNTLAVDAPTATTIADIERSILKALGENVPDAAFRTVIKQDKYFGAKASEDTDVTKDGRPASLVSGQVVDIMVQLTGIWAHPTAGYGAMLKVLDAMVEEPKPRQVARGQRSSRSSALDLLRWRNHCNMAPISCASV